MPSVVDLLRKQLDALLAEMQGEEGPLSPEKFDKLAKAVTSGLKAIEAAEAHADASAARTVKLKHTSYEDFPPPTPEDTARFEARLRDAILRLPNTQPASAEGADILSPAAGQDAALPPLAASGAPRAD